jgi:putative FmdB family regulatory protein
MPTYEFRCPDGHTFDRFYRKMSDAVSEVPCPECGKPATRQLSGGAGLVFKGSGFYLTDYGKNAHRKAEPANGAKPSGESAGADSKSEGAKPSESKAESKSESKTDTKASEPKAGQAKTGGTGSSGSSSDK